MVYNQEVHHRRSIRLREYDYSRAGAYFVTICTWQRECLFGAVNDGMMELNPYGHTVLSVWRDLPRHYRHVELDEFVIMPNHVHGIIIINAPVGAQFIAPEPIAPEPQISIADHRCGTDQGVVNKGAMNRAPTVGEIVRGCKARCTRAINQLRDNLGGPIWQRNYYERVIRDNRELDGIRKYIADNPVKWVEDENHPARL